MKITLVIHDLPGGGTGRVLTYMANYWANEGHHVTILTLEKRGSPFYPLSDSVKWISLNISSNSANLVEGLLKNLRRIYLLRKAVLKSTPDCIISFVFTTNMLVLLATRFINSPLIISERNHPGYGTRTRLAWYWLRRILYPLADHLVVQTREIKDWFHRYNNSIHIIANPVGTVQEVAEFSSEVTLPSGKSIVAMGQLSPQKGFDLLLKVFAKIHQTYKEWNLIILGTGPMKEELVLQAGQLGIERYLHLPGMVTNPLSVLKKCDLFVLSSRYEGLPNVLLEAMACGLPVVSFDCPSGPSEVIRDRVNGLLVPLKDLDALKDAIESLIKDEKLRLSLGREAVKVQDKFSLEKVMSQWNNLLHKYSLTR